MGLKTALGLKKRQEYTPAIDISPFLEESTSEQIPRLLHFIWVGDDSKRPDKCIESWRQNHPEWEVRVWGNDDYNNRKWRLKSHMQEMWGHELNGVADMMRYEILLEHGGIAVDADSFSLRAIPEWLLRCEAVAANENEISTPGMLACCFMGTKPGNPFFEALVSGLERDRFALRRKILGVPYKFQRAWKSVGPRYFTRIYHESRYFNLTVLPSHFFTPDTGRGHYVYNGGGPVYSYHLWSSTFSDY